LGSATNTIVINHAIARHYVKYQNTRFLEYHRSLNTRDNIFRTVRETVGSVDRQHFIPLRMPTSIPSLSHIKRAEESMEDVESIKRFNSFERLMFLEVWKWLGSVALIVWYTLIVGHILRSALDIGFVTSTAIAFSYLLAGIVLVAGLYPESV
jgi:hypothetical protein